MDGGTGGAHSYALSPALSPGSGVGMGVAGVWALSFQESGSPGKGSSMLPGLSGLSSGAIGTQAMSCKSRTARTWGEDSSNSFPCNTVAGQC